MKLFKTGLAALAATGMFALNAQADSSQTFTVQGDVPVICQANFNSVVSPEIIDLTSSATQNLGSITYVCNTTGGFVRTISSANAGILKNGTGGAAKEIPYQLSSGGGSGLGFALTSLATPKVTSLGGSTAFIAGQTGSLSVQVSGSTAGLYAGTYSDDVTLAVVAN